MRGKAYMLRTEQKAGKKKTKTNGGNMYKILFTIILGCAACAQATDFDRYVERSNTYNPNAVNEWLEKQQDKLYQDRQQDMMQRQTQALEDAVRIQKQYYYEW